MRRESLPNCGACAGGSCGSNAKPMDWAGGSSESGSTNRAFTEVWHKLHGIVRFGACAGGTS